MDEGSRYWCHMCTEWVIPNMEAEIKCPLCDSGFIEDVGSQRPSDHREDTNDNDDDDDILSELGSDHSLSLWAPILLGMMGSPSWRRRRSRRGEDSETASEGELGRDWDLVSALQRRRRTTAVLQLLRELREGRALDSESSETERQRERDRERERVILINPFNQAIILEGSFDQSSSRNTPSGSFGDYFLGSSLDQLLQHLADNDPNRYGTPPAQKEVVEALPTVKIVGNLSCSVCLEDFEVGAEAKEMPCNHKFHSGCILPWLELHSSCPVCRFQLPSEGSKDSSNGSSANGDNRLQSSISGGGDGEDGGRRSSSWVPVPWPFNGLFSLSDSQNGGGDGENSSSTHAPPGPGSAASRPDED
ncbi:E3 ubiquitin-protein ligase RING1 [Acorus calamus]|uniref:RING-type E3 ubiquitin transferase n=1 Tax=Acorus calamus TaxID=4465 RepID=A0AAV9CQY4_ACOCL|nr:E3 ubiquitin-protein ligase RING1 [Acorus calamus]